MLGGGLNISHIGRRGGDSKVNYTAVLCSRNRTVQYIPYSIRSVQYKQIKKWGVQYARIFFRIRTVCTIENTG